MLGVFLDRGSVDCGDLDLSALVSALPSWNFYDQTPSAAVRDRVAGAQVVVTNKVALDAELLADSDDLRLICVAATGTNNVDLQAARERGITVSNVRAYGTPAVVQHVFALLLSLVTRLHQYRDWVHQGHWQRHDMFCSLDFPISELHGKNLGIIGFGELGQGVASVAEAFGMKVLVCQRPGTQTASAGRIALPELLPQVDVLSIHCPLTADTAGLIGRQQIALMRPHAILINTARGGIVDEQAVVDALRGGQLGGAGFDVLSEEPPRHGNVLLQTDIANLIVTPHTAWASRESRQRMVDQLVENIRAFLAGQSRNVVA